MGLIRAKARGKKDEMAFINISNHPSDKWSDGQRAAARELGREGEIDAMVRAEYHGGEEFCAEACYYRANLRETHEGTIYDVPFPAIKYDGRPIHDLFRELTEEIEVEVWGCGPDEDHVLMIQGETAFTLYLVRHFAPHFRVVVAVSDRNTTDNPDGTKTVRFEFQRFVPVNWIYDGDLIGKTREPFRPAKLARAEAVAKRLSTPVDMTMTGAGHLGHRFAERELGECS